MPLLQKFGSRHGNISDIESIIDNLNNVLNSKKGFSSPLSDFGIRDMNEYSSRDIIAKAIIAEVRENIEKYEPRVEVTRIVVEDNKDILKLSFKIECRIKENAKSLRMVFDSVFNNVHIDNWS
jgi:type VI secretion system protein